MQLADRRPKFALSFGRERLIKPLLFFNFFFLCTTFNLFDLGGRNLLFIGYTIMSGATIILVTRRSVPMMGGSWVLLFVYLIFSFLFNANSAKLTSFLYSVFFLLSYWLIINYFKRYVSKEAYAYLVKNVLLVFFLVLLLGQLYVSLGFFTNVSNSQYGIVHNAFGTLFEPGRNAFRYYSMATEPSNAAFIVIVLFYSYLMATVERVSFHRKNIPFWIMLLYMIYFFKSGYGVILFALLLFVLFRKKENFIPFLVLGALLLIIVTALQTSAINRVYNVISKVDINNILSLQRIDYSASFRVLPFFYYLKDINPWDPQFYIGHGAGTSSSFLIPLLFSSPVESFEGGFLPQFLYDYGIIVFALLLVFLRENVIKSFLSFEMIVILLMMTNANFNTQLFWITICSFSLNKFYSCENKQFDENRI